MLRHARKILVLLLVALGGLAALILMKPREAPKRVPLEERVTPVRVVEAPSVAVAPRVLGYGNVKPGRVWEAVGQVGGAVVYRHPELRKGAILRKGTELLRIDPADYRLSVAQIEANIRSVEAQVRVLDVRARNTEGSLAIEERRLDLGRKQLERKRELLRRGAISRSEVEQEERSVLAGEQAVQNLRNAMKLLPAERSVQEAARDRLKAQLEMARRDLGRTSIVAPFTCRIAAVHVELSQFAARGQVLVEADGLDVAEVIAQAPLGKMLTLLPPEAGVPAGPGAAMPRLRGVTDIEAVVRLRTGDVDVEWPARFLRMSDTVDPRTRTVGVIVAVDDPYRQAEPGGRPPLVKNMYVEVELRGPPRPRAVVVPRAALDGNRVYVAGPDDRLVGREVEAQFAQTNFVALRSGVAPGERVVVSDLPFAVEGMRVRPVVDRDATESLVAEAAGATPVR